MIKNFGMAVVVTTALLIGQVSAAAPAAKPSADGKLNVAVMALKNASGINEGEAGLIADRLRGELFNTGRANVMEREQMQEVLKEQGFQQSGTCTDEACMVQMGQLLGVQAIISGSIGKLGNLYMINLRIIDVQTGRIVQVVSEDIKGELEEVVGRLPGIAARLVGQTAPPPPPPPPKKSEPVVETPKAEPQPVTPAVAPVAGPVAVLNGEKEDRNRNRGGLRISYSMFPGTLKSSAKTSSLSLSDYIQSDSAAQFYNAQSFGPSITNNFALLFFIKAGKFINISIGPSFLYNSQEITSYDNATLATSDLTRTITVTAIEPGVNFVKRIYPLKINAGLFVDFNMLTFNNDYSSTSSLGVSDNWTDFDMGFGIGGGARGGVEIMLGKHVGLNAELVYRFATFSTIESSKFSLEYSVTPQMLGFGFGANFYF